MNRFNRLMATLVVSIILAGIIALTRTELAGASVGLQASPSRTAGRRRGRFRKRSRAAAAA